MKYESPNAFRAALEQRLRTMSRDQDTPLIRLRKLVTFDRLLARLMHVAPDRWILKGALALDYRIEGSFRTTNDLDLSRLTEGSVEAVIRDFVAAQSFELGDYFAFTVQRAGRAEPAESATARFHATAEVAGRKFETIAVDVGLRDPLLATPEIVSGPDLLSFADIGSTAIPALPLTQHIAEKVHAYTRIYPGQRRSTRAKGLADIVIMQSHGTFEAGRLRAALEMIFDHRATHPLPKQLPPPPVDWGVAYRRLATEMGIEPDVSSGHRSAAVFLDAILGALVPDDAAWNRENSRWE